MRNKRITACVVAQNCSDTIKQTLNQLLILFDNIIITYDDSFDNTEEILMNYKLKYYNQITLYKNKFIDIGQQKTFCTSKVVTDWVFIIDSDELVSEMDYDKYIILAEKNNIGAFYLKRYNLILDKFHYRIKGFPDNQIRLMRKIHSKVYEPVHHRYYDIPNNMKKFDIKNGFIIHFADIRDDIFLTQKGIDRVKLSDNDECDGIYLKNNIEWFNSRKRMWCDGEYNKVPFEVESIIDLYYK